MALIRLERPVHYGNTGLAFNEVLPIDDPYIFKPENTRDLWSHARQITERYGYDFRFDEFGNAVLMTRNNPLVVFDFITSDCAPNTPTEGVHPNAHAGTYMEFTGTVSAFSVDVPAARIDLVLPRGTLGAWTVSVARTSDPGTPIIAPMTLDPSGDEDLYFYDYRNTTDGTNATVVTIYTGYFDTYRVTLSSSGGSGGTIRKLDCLQLWHRDPHNPLLPTPLTTAGNALEVQAPTSMNEMRNMVLVVGRRRAVVTDSEKLELNPENPVHEFVVQRAVDLGSIVHAFEADGITPRPNFTGWAKESIIFDSGVTDDDFAAFLARTFIYRYRLPKNPAQVNHTLLPVVQLRDPLYVDETTFKSADTSNVLYVKSITHRITPTAATTDLETSAYPEYPSYEVREDIDIDRTFNHNPVINVNVSYTSLSGDPQSNLDKELVHRSTDEQGGDIVRLSNISVSGSSPNRYLDMSGQPWPPIPGSVILTPSAISGSGVATTLDFPLAANDDNNGEPELDWANVRTGSVLGPYIIQNAMPGTVVIKMRPRNMSNYTTITARTWEQAAVEFGWYFELTADAVTLRRTASPYKALDNEDEWRVRIEYMKAPAGAATKVYANNPYHQIYKINYSDGTRRIDLPFRQGDGSSSDPDGSGGYGGLQFTAFDVMYRKLGPVSGGGTFDDPYDGNAPFYDPYTSQLGYLVNVKFDALVSGLYRISIRSSYDDTIVAWLSEPTGDPNEEEAHWLYMTAGTNKHFTWDGVDQLGTWNRAQSQAYADAAHGAFAQDERPLVGAGFYAWNREVSFGGYSPLALISGERDGSGKPVFGQGGWGEWYVHFEVKNDRLEEIFDEAKEAESPILHLLSYPRRVRSDLMQDTADGEPYAAMIYTHVPEPTRVRMIVSDWKGGLYTPSVDTDSDASWATTASDKQTANPDATINNQKPVRIRFEVESRPGALWSGKDDEVEVKLNRSVHLRVNVADQLVIGEGVNYPGQDVEERKILNRKFTNDDHTLVFSDAHYRKAKTFKSTSVREGTEWIFTPNQFQKDFRGTANEPLQFADYLQLEELPKWDADRTIAGTRARFQIGFMNYLFYLSCYTSDRSGRYVWCLDRDFLDRSKLLNATAADFEDSDNPCEWPLDWGRQFKRSVVTRQWAGEKAWPTAAKPSGQTYVEYMTERWGLGAIGQALCAHKWHQHGPWASYIGAYSGDGGNQVSWVSQSGPLERDDYSHWHADRSGAQTEYEDYTQLLPSVGFSGMIRQLGSGASTALGAWTWETGPLWIPCVTRDFHGYYCVPPMVDHPARTRKEEGASGADTWIGEARVQGAINWLTDYCYGTVDYRRYVKPNDERTEGNTGDDAAAATIWNSPVWDMTQGYDSGAAGLVRFFQGRVVSPGTEPTEIVASNVLDYQRQDALVHWEDLRGLYTRGPRPAESPKKIQPVAPYYQNVYQYGPLYTFPAYNQEKLLPIYKADVFDFFQMTFREEYVWESSHYFPTELYGRENLSGMNCYRTHLHPTPGKLRWDGGAWVGWKDDIWTPNGSLPEPIVTVDFSLVYPQYVPTTYRTENHTVTIHKMISPFRGDVSGALVDDNIFESPYLIAGTSTAITTTRDMIFHMVLVDERREVSAG